MLIIFYYGADCESVQGRISRRVTVPVPDEAGRAAILGVHLRGVTLDESAGDKTELARQLATLTAGFSGAQDSGLHTCMTHAHVPVSAKNHTVLIACSSAVPVACSDYRLHEFQPMGRLRAVLAIMTLLLMCAWVCAAQVLSCPTL